MSCEREREVAAAVRTGEWPEELRAHWAGCEECAEAALVAEFLREAAATADRQVPEAGLVWFKSQLRARREAAARAARPLEMAERAAAVVAVICGVVAAAWLSRTGTLAAMVGVAAVFLMGAAAGGALLVARSRK